MPRNQPSDPHDPAGYSDRITQPSRHRVLTVGLATAMCAIAIAAWRMRFGLSLIGDSGSYLAGASGLSQGRFFDTPLVPSFSELPLLDTVRNAGWSPYADFGIGLPVVIALFNLVLPLTTAAALVNVLSIGFIALGIVIGPWSPHRDGELWFRSAVGFALGCWPIVRFTSVGVLSEPLFCAALVWLAIVIARSSTLRLSYLFGIGALTVTIGTLRFVGPIVAVVVAVLLTQRGLSSRRAALWGTITAVGPFAATLLATGGAGTRVVSLHSLDASDVFFTARGVGGWFEAGFGNQTATLLRTEFQPNVGHWLITVCTAIGACAVIVMWIGRIRRHASDALEPALVLAVVLALSVVPSMVFIDAVVKLENRILMPSGLLVLGAIGWWLGRQSRASFMWSALVLWTIIATHPWQWLERPEPAASTALTDTVRGLGARHIVTDRADLVWWITRVPARYLPDGYHDLSDRYYDVEPIMRALPCALERTDGAIVVDTTSLSPLISDLLDADVREGRYERRVTSEDIAVLVPTGRRC